MRRAKWFAVRAPLSPTSKTLIGVLSFIVPLAVWSAVSYVPWIWHPMVEISDPGSVSYLKPGMLMARQGLHKGSRGRQEKRGAPTTGAPRQSRLSARPARGGGSALHFIHDQAGNARRRSGSTKAYGTAFRSSSGAFGSRRSSASRLPRLGGVDPGYGDRRFPVAR